MSYRSLRFLAAPGVLALGLGAAQAQAPVPRPTPAAGAIVAAKGGEEMRFVREELWRAAPVQQSVVGGDTLRTNAIGSLALLFADQTQIRVGRNSTLTVSEVAGGSAGTTQLSLQGGAIWARAARGGTGVDVRTPAAVAAIRGTDWSLTVDGAGKTSLIVLEGVVELTNAQGSVTVRQGEGAVAAIGQAPTKYILVRPNDREQMMFYLTLRDGFNWLKATPLQGPALRAERARLEALPPSSRRAEDWLSRAEIALALDGYKVAASVLAEARRHSLSTSQKARADLVEGLIAGAERRWSDAEALLARAERHIDSKRRVAVVYGRYIAGSLADPKRVLAEPRTNPNDPEAALAHAFITGFKQDLPAAAEELKKAEKRFPRDPGIAVFSSQVSFALNRREEMRASLERARAADPDHHLVLAMSGRVKADVDSQRLAALADLRKAAATAPGDSEIWNAMGMLLAELEAPLEAEAAFRRSMEVDPENPLPYSNLAILLLDQSRVEEAGALIDKALDIDPGFDIAYIARGRYLLQKGNLPGAIESILAGSAANPAYSNGLAMAAIAYYQNGEIELADQALDNADRLDPNDPTNAIIRTAIALDQYRADDAVRAAREAIKRSRARGGDYAGLSATRQSGSFPADAYRFIGLHEWGRFYGDRTYDPFSASSYFDQAANIYPNVVTTKPSLSSVETGSDTGLSAVNLLVQGLLFDPLALGGRLGRIDLARRPFLDTEVGGTLISRGGEIGWKSELTATGYSNEPIPTAFSLSAGRLRDNGRYTYEQERLDNAALFIGAAPSAADRLLFFGTFTQIDPGAYGLLFPTVSHSAARDATEYQLGAGWSHTFGYKNVLTAAVFAARSDDRQRTRETGIDSTTFEPYEFIGRQNVRAEASVFSLSHMIGFNDLTFRYGAEALIGETETAATQDFNGFPLGSETADASFSGSRVFANLFWRPADWFEAEAGLERTVFDVEAAPADSHVAPRAGIAVSPFEGQWLRAAYRSDVLLPSTSTLSPITTVGLLPNTLPLNVGGRADTLMLRWDAEWSPHFFTSVEYQRQDIEGLSLPIPEGFDTITIDKARVERVAATANLWLGHGIGVFGTVGSASSEIRSGNVYGEAVPYVAGKFARAGVTFVHPSRLKFTLAQTFMGDLTGNIAGQPLKDYWTTDASLTWETPDRRLSLGLTALNLFDREYDAGLDQFDLRIPASGRTVAATVKARF